MAVMAKLTIMWMNMLMQRQVCEPRRAIWTARLVCDDTDQDIEKVVIIVEKIIQLQPNLSYRTEYDRRNPIVLLWN